MHWANCQRYVQRLDVNMDGSGILCLFGVHKGDKMLSKFSLEERNINTKYIEDSSNISFLLQNSKHFPCLRLLYVQILASGQFSIPNLLGMLDLSNYCYQLLVYLVYFPCTWVAHPCSLMDYVQIKKRFSNGKPHNSRTSMCIPPMIKEKKFHGLVFFAFKNVFLPYFNLSIWCPATWAEPYIYRT